ncbi:SDR family NAD(P)-dependent oxidoreductase [Streptomyces sp. NBC_00485]|uniref:SDR family NAD(P)-dependent oxidoreductase n=1 Tax=Streptomyces sp. NBC_00485 TaxID=2975758 RepID=UPI0022566D14|nr:SDR family NAD(P)-dependent oxidoreductase [Streptomyces sp. NBC_00474]
MSVLSWFSFPQSGAYCAAKSAEWSLSNALRVQLAEQGIRVAGLHVGPMDTDMVREADGPKPSRRSGDGRHLQATTAWSTELRQTTARTRARPGPAGEYCSSRIPTLHQCTFANGGDNIGVYVPVSATPASAG